MSSLATALGLPHYARATSRREWLAHAGAGFGGLALASLVGGGAARAAAHATVAGVVVAEPVDEDGWTTLDEVFARRRRTLRRA
jgi:hypothetical protein